MTVSRLFKTYNFFPRVFLAYYLYMRLDAAFLFGYAGNKLIVDVEVTGCRNCVSRKLSNVILISSTRWYVIHDAGKNMNFTNCFRSRVSVTKTNGLFIPT